MKLRDIILFTVLLAILSACKDLSEPVKENNRGIEETPTDPNYTVGLLGYGYAMLPYENTSVSNTATDDAVTNDMKSNYSRMALGAWALNSSPMEQW